MEQQLDDEFEILSEEVIDFCRIALNSVGIPILDNADAEKTIMVISAVTDKRGSITIADLAEVERYIDAKYGQDSLTLPDEGDLS